MKIPFKRAKAQKGPSEAQVSKKSAQEWLPFNDIYNGFIYRKDKHMVAVNRVEPINMALKSKKEKERIITCLHEVINPQTEDIHIYTIPRPVDLDKYLEEQQKKAKETTNPPRKRLLNEYIRYMAGKVYSGETMERRYYIAVTQEPGKKQKEELNKKIYDINFNIGGAELPSSVADTSVILDMLFSFLQPGRAAYEMPPDESANFVTLYKGGLNDGE